MSLFGLGSRRRQDPPDPFSLDRVLLQLSRDDDWTVRDAVEGTQIFGAVGSGKTTGSGHQIAKAFLRNGFGGLVLTAKPDEPDLWKQYCAETGRSNDLVLFGPSHSRRFNFLDYEFKRPSPGGGETENLVRLFHTVLELGEGGGKSHSQDPFWERAAKQMLRNAIEIVGAAHGEMRLRDLYHFMTSAPMNMEEVASEEWQAKSECIQTIRNGLASVTSTPREPDFDHAASYWLREFPSLAEKTRSVIMTSFTSMADCFLRGKLRELFCTTTDLTPEATHDGKIIVVDLPIKNWAEIGRYAQVVFKLLWQQAAERRRVSSNTRPLFLWADEAQFFVTRQDAMFQTTARSSRVATVFLTQNLPNYFSVLGADKHETESLMGNLSTKIFHANGDPTTNQWAADIFARSWQTRTSSGFSEERQGKSGSHNMGFSDSLEYDVQPQTFTSLGKGGPHSGGKVEAIVFQGGRIWKASGKNSLRVFFQQPRHP